MAIEGAPELIPITLLTGFLGSGKTTVLNNLVHQPELRDALVIINEFGEIALDHLLVAHSTENVLMEMSSGCLCCTVRGDLVKTLRHISWRFSRNGERHFRRVLIETTGLADPAPIIHTLMSDPHVVAKYRLDGIVATIDLAAGMSTLDHHREAVKQAAIADVLLLTKGDLVKKDERTMLLHRLGKVNPAAAHLEARHGVVAAEKVLGLGLFNGEDKSPDVSRWLAEEFYRDESTRHHQPGHDHGHWRAHDNAHASSSHGHAHPPKLHGEHADHQHDVNRHDDMIRAFCFTIEDPIPEDVLISWLEVLMGFLGSKILRVKGILNIENRTQPLAVHGVQHIFHPPVSLPAWPSDDRRSKLVFITLDVGRDVIERTFRALHRSQPNDTGA